MKVKARMEVRAFFLEGRVGCGARLWPNSSRPLLAGIVWPPWEIMEWVGVLRSAGVALGLV